MKKIGGYPHNGYPTNIGTGTGRIFIQWVRYKRVTTSIISASLTSLDNTELIMYFFLNLINGIFCLHLSQLSIYICIDLIYQSMYLFNL